MFNRYPCVRQRDETDCGPAVLATVARVHRRALSVAQIREVAGTDLMGTNMLGLRIGAEAIGFHANGVRAQWRHLQQQVSFPAIAFVHNDRGDGHFVVLHKIVRRGVLVADPAVGRTELWSREAFLERWLVHPPSGADGQPGGVLLLLTPTPKLRQTETSTTRGARLWALLAPRMPLLWQTFLCSLVATVLAIGSSLFIQVLVDRVLVHEKRGVLNLLAIGMGLLILFRAMFGVLRQYLLVHLAQKIDLELLLSYYGHLFTLPMRFFRTRQVGEVLSRMNDSHKIRALIQGTTLGLLLDATMFLVASVVMFYYHWKLTLIVFSFLPAFLALVLLINRPVRRIERRLMEQTADVEAHMVESLSGVATIKAFAAETSAKDKAETTFVKVIDTGFNAAMLTSGATTAAGLLTGTIGLFVLWYGGHQVIGGQLSLGQLMFFNSMLGYLVDPMQRLAEVNITVQEALVALDRMGETLDIEPEQTPGHGHRPATVRGQIQLRDLSFAYGHRPPVLKRINLSIEPGTTVAIVGESGSGKTTLANLLARFDDPQEGGILLDGTDLRDWELGALRGAMGIVPQETYIFRGRVVDNIRLGHPEASLTDVIEAARKAGADGFIAQLPHRYATLIGERGADLSGGQRQRLAIARALLHRPSLLILDEATSSLDSESEWAIQQTLEQLKGSVTCVLIAHRLSTVMHADKIVVLHGGELAEEGTHDALMAARGKYYQLWTRQLPRSMRLALEGDPPRAAHAVCSA